MKLFIKSTRQFTLKKLLSRRGMTLHQFVNEQGISTYETLVDRCRNLGVVEPSLYDFVKVSPNLNNSPDEGLVVLNSPQIIDEKSGKGIEVEEPKIGFVTLKGKPKRPKKKKMVNPVITQNQSGSVKSEQDSDQFGSDLNEVSGSVVTEGSVG
jgi:hypothetical protein